jgi:hypothetical protein
MAKRKKWDERHLRALRYLANEYGSEAVRLQLDELKHIPPPKRGQPKNFYTNVFWEFFGPFLEMKFPGGIPKGHVYREIGKIVKQELRGHQENYLQVKDPDVRNAWDPKSLGVDADAIIRRLIKYMPKKLKPRP